MKLLFLVLGQLAWYVVVFPFFWRKLAKMAFRRGMTEAEYEAYSLAVKFKEDKGGHHR